MLYNNVDFKKKEMRKSNQVFKVSLNSTLLSQTPFWTSLQLYDTELATYTVLGQAFHYCKTLHGVGVGFGMGGSSVLTSTIIHLLWNWYERHLFHSNASSFQDSRMKPELRQTVID